jgi:hypothetical protein
MSTYGMGVRGVPLSLALGVVFTREEVTVSSQEGSLRRRGDEYLTGFICLAASSRCLSFVNMEINPLVMTDTMLTPLDMAAKIDETVHFLKPRTVGTNRVPFSFWLRRIPCGGFCHHQKARSD